MKSEKVSEKISENDVKVKRAYEKPSVKNLGKLNAIIKGTGSSHNKDKFPMSGNRNAGA